ncbi:WD repeat-containing protein 91-like [Salvia hispanica]|uniref:WD repeat-containing protein 91-like n=1 Tax=Salvia hispanica TaxID=49212 RepID=UPI0020093A21|nr:WD repeat-containing protein 91-like [Salvia hispanica]
MNICFVFFQNIEPFLFWISKYLAADIQQTYIYLSQDSLRMRKSRFKKEGMDQVQFADGLVKEFLVYRGFTSTLQAFEKDLATDIVGKGFQVDDIMNLIFGVYVPQYEAAKLIDLLIFFSSFTNSDQKWIDMAAKLQQSVLRYYVVYCLKHEKRDAVLELFEIHGKGLVRIDPSWCNWFSLPYLPNPHLDSRFNNFFSDEWFQTLYISLRTFLSIMLTGPHILNQ